MPGIEIGFVGIVVLVIVGFVIVLFLVALPVWIGGWASGA
jgi:hypothetical protein